MSENQIERNKELLSDGHSVVLYVDGSDVAVVLAKDDVDIAVLTPQAALELFDWLLRMATTIEQANKGQR